MKNSAVSLKYKLTTTEQLQTKQKMENIFMFLGGGKLHRKHA